MIKDIQKLLRNNLRNRIPYSSARDEFNKTADIWLDANENPFENGINRYPDPRQQKLKEVVGRVKQIPKENVFIGNGSDEVLDLLFRAFCEPRIDNVVTIEPTYGMYQVLAEINDVEFRKAPLNGDYSLNVKNMIQQIDSNTKLIFLCSPNNPTGNLLDEKAVEQLLNSTSALVVIDEAYIDFSEKKGFLSKLNQYPRLVVVQTLSKAWGLAGLRLGLGFASAEIIRILDGIKPPYNVNTNSQFEAIKHLKHPDKTNEQIRVILQEKEKMQLSLKDLPGVRKIFPSDTNFLLVEIAGATEIYKALLKKGIVLRNRSGILYCKECLRITIGTPEENQRLIQELKKLVQ
jgi:histidinol-phosphate aminotransferase